jgi:glycine cleavage system H protein
MSAPANYRFSPTHEWIDASQPVASVGISQHAQSQLGDIVYLDLPKVGRVVKAREPVAVIESVKAASDIYAPVDGEIVEVNQSAADDTTLVNSDPYGAGWLFKIKVADAAQPAALLDEAAYQATLG